MKISIGEVKRAARKNVKQHYLIFILVTLLSIVIGSEFTETLSGLKLKNTDQTTETQSGVVTTTLLDNPLQITDVIDEILEDDSQYLPQITDLLGIQMDSGEVLGTERGVFASVFNSITSGNLWVTFVATIAKMAGSENLAMVIALLLVLIFQILLYVFIANVYKAAMRRLFLEGRIYEKVPLKELLYIMRVRRWRKAAWTLFVCDVKLVLWWFTIIGGMIKTYSYAMVPYIVAENPDISAKDAIRLSREMMNGYKWNLFVLDISFIGWALLGSVTFGLPSLFWTNAYSLAATTEYYSKVRQKAKDNGILNADLLDDTYLFEYADQELLDETYQDYEGALEEIDAYHKPARTGLKGWLIHYLGIVPYSDDEEKEYEHIQALMIQTADGHYITQKRQYPLRLNPLDIKTKEFQEHFSIHYKRHYSLTSLAIMFFGFACVGWLWEVGLEFIKAGIFINRGTLHGPWVPIYGAGTITVLCLLYRARKNPAKHVLLTVLLCGCLEYFSGYALELMHGGKKWWDYSGYFLNLHGRICAEGLLVFAIGGTAFVYLIAPLLDEFNNRQNQKVMRTLALVLTLVFTADLVYSQFVPNEGKGITDTTTEGYVEPEDSEFSYELPQEKDITYEIMES